MSEEISHPHLITDSGGGGTVKAFARKMVKGKSAPKGCIMTGESVQVQEVNKVQMAGAFISRITNKRITQYFLLECIW
jgi:hypothetical protein